MPRSPTVYSLPPGTTPQVPDTPISSSMFNAAMDDVAQTFNTIQPVAYGGNGVADNKPLTNSFGLKDSTDLTKIVTFDLSALSTATTRTVGLQNASGILAYVNQLEVGQCRIALSGGNIVLSPYNGNLIRIAGAIYAIPSAGVSLAPTGLATATDLNVYAYMNSGTMTLEAVTTAYAVDTTAGNIGVRIKAGDATRTLVGKVRLAAGPVFVDTSARRFVISWFNRKPIGVQNNFTTDRSTSSGTYVEVDAEIRCEFLTWADSSVSLGLSGCSANNTGGRGTITAIGVDGISPEAPQSYSTSATAGADYGVGLSLSRAGLSEGYHYATLLGRTDGVGTATYRGTASTNGRTVVTVMIQG